MRVLKIIHTMGHGGAENIFRWLAWRLRKDGIDVVAGIPLDNDPKDRENWITPALRELDVPYETYDRTGSPFDLLMNMKSLIRRVRPDIVHSHLLDSNVYSALACRWLSVPHLCTEHGDIALRNTVSSKIKFAAVSLCSDSIVCVSEAVRRRAAGMTVFRSKLGLIYNGIVFSGRGRRRHSGRNSVSPANLFSSGMSATSTRSKGSST